MGKAFDTILRLCPMSVADGLLMVWVRLPVDWIDSVRSRTIDIRAARSGGPIAI